MSEIRFSEKQISLLFTFHNYIKGGPNNIKIENHLLVVY
jgi:hypothetical protein